MKRTYKYRLYPTKAQQTRLEQTLELCGQLYNAALEERRISYRIAKVSTTYGKQSAQ